MSRCQPFQGISTEIISEMTFKTVVLSFSILRSENLVKYVDFWIQILDIQARNLDFYLHLQPCSEAYGPQKIH